MICLVIQLFMLQFQIQVITSRKILLTTGACIWEEIERNESLQPDVGRFWNNRTTLFLLDALGILLPRAKWLEMLPSARALKIQGDAGEGTRWISSPKAFAVVPAPRRFSQQT